MNEKKHGTSSKVIIYLLLAVWAVVVLFPFYWMVLTSVKKTNIYNNEKVPRIITEDPTLENYGKAFEYKEGTQGREGNLKRYFINTLIYTIATTGIMMMIIIPAAFAFARLNFRGKNLLFALFLSLMMIPSELVIITNFVTITNLGLNKGNLTFLGLVLPSVTSVFYIYLLKENFEAIPDELYNAAKVDGTSDLKYLLKVMVPISQPTIVTILILKIIECWNSYVWPRLIVREPIYYLVSNGIQAINADGKGRSDDPAMMAAVVVVSVPLIVLFLVFRDKIMAGVSRGGTKG